MSIPYAIEIVPGGPPPAPGDDPAGVDLDGSDRDEFCIHFQIMKRPAGQSEFGEIGHGSSGNETTLEEAAGNVAALLRSLTNRQGELAVPVDPPPSSPERS